MIQVTEIERNGNAAVKKLRINKLRKGSPFMINSNDLPGYQCYLEYPNGSIVLASITRFAKEFTTIRELTPQEIDGIKLRFNLQ